MDDVEIRGRKGSLHFIRFPTAEMGNFLALAKSKGMAQLVTTVCATGGGAFKFEENFMKVSFDYSFLCNFVFNCIF
jgi:type II pantothenate kinase